MKVVFRTDASLDIGTGHVMRCLTLADVLKSGGAHCHFISREHPGNLINEIRQRGFPVVGLANGTEVWAPRSLPDVDPPSYDTWLRADWATDAAQTRVGAGDTPVDWIIADHYALDARWEKAVRPMCRKLMVIDDLADRSHDCDLLLDQNLGRNVREYSERVPLKCTVLTGPYYALLRPEFATLRDYSLCRRAIPQLEHLLIAMGGVDRGDATGRILDALKACPLPDKLRITVVMGPHAPWLEHVRALAAEMPRPTEVKVHVQDMARLMADSDLAIGAAGSTSWERCCLGLPTLIVVLAENQRKVAAALERSGGVKVLNGLDTISRDLRLMFDVGSMSVAGLRQMSEASCPITDGQGTSRVARVLVESHD